MAGISVSGAGSGIDLASLLQQLVSAERASPTQRFDTQQKKAESQLSALGTLKGSVSSLSGAVDAIKALGAFRERTATSSDEERFTATADSAAAPGTYQVTVESLAKAQKLASDHYGSSSATVGTGTLTLGVGAKSFAVTIGATNNTLAGIRDAINAASDNAGVRASIITADDGAHLVLTATEGGTAHALTVSQSGGDGGLAGLTYPGGLVEKQQAVDAVVTVDGFTYTSSSNAVSGAIPGVTIDLVKAEPGVTAELTIEHDKTAVKTAIKDFVTAYNGLRKAITTATAYNPENKTAAALAGDTLPRGLASSLRGILGTEVDDLPDGAKTMLSSIGITSSNDGTLKVDEEALDGALDTDFDGVQAMFTSAKGFATSLDAMLDKVLAAKGAFKTRETTLHGQLDRIADQREALERRLDAMERRLKAQFSALDTMVSKMRSTGDALTQSLARI